MFLTERASADQERAHLSTWRVRDEFWFAERFGLNWPRLGAFPGETATAAGDNSKARPGGKSGRTELVPSPGPSARVDLAPSPAP
jgi:hypothetical protein